MSFSALRLSASEGSRQRAQRPYTLSGCKVTAFFSNRQAFTDNLCAPHTKNPLCRANGCFCYGKADSDYRLSAKQRLLVSEAVLAFQQVVPACYFAKVMAIFWTRTCEAAPVVALASAKVNSVASMPLMVMFLPSVATVPAVEVTSPLAL